MFSCKSYVQSISRSGALRYRHKTVEGYSKSLILTYSPAGFAAVTRRSKWGEIGAPLVKKDRHSPFGWTTPHMLKKFARRRVFP
jgi:hypothetical protein